VNTGRFRGAKLKLHPGRVFVVHPVLSDYSAERVAEGVGRLESVCVR
jgi:hypothetical protein